MCAKIKQVRARALFFRFGIVICTGISSCSGGIAPAPSKETVVEHVLAAENNHTTLRIFDAETELSVQTALGGSLEGLTTQTDGRIAYVGVRLPSGSRDLIAVDMAGSILWRTRLGDSIGVLTGEVLGAAPDGRTLFIWRGISSGTQGLSVIDVESRLRVAHSANWNVASNGLVPLPRSDQFPEGAVLLVGVRSGSGGPRGASRAYVLHAKTLAVVDSIVLPEDIWQVVPSPSGGDVYIIGSQNVVRYHLSSRRTTASMRRSVNGSATVLVNGQLVMTDAGSFPDTPGSGLLHLFSADLRSNGTIDISTPLGGVPNSQTAVRSGLIQLSAHGNRVWVRVGSEDFGPLYAPQKARLLLVDCERREVVRTLDLDGFGLGALAISRRTIQ
jgi:hypothetical protein